MRSGGLWGKTGLPRALWPYAAGMAVLLILALAPSAWLAWQGRDLPHLGSFHDDGLYMGAARALAEGRAYTIESLPWQPPQTKYPPLFAAYLSLAWLGGTDLAGAAPRAMLLVWLCLPVWLAGAWVLYRRQGYNMVWTLSFLVLLALHPYSQLGATRLMTDLLFSALTVWALALLETLWPAEQSLAAFDRRMQRPMLALGVVLLILAYSTRSAALPVMAAACLVLAWRRQWAKLGAVAAGCGVAAGGWMLWAGRQKLAAAGLAPTGDIITQYYTDYFSYQARMVPLDTMGRHVVSQIDHLINAATTMLLVNFGDGLGWIFVKRILFAGLVLGVVRLMREGRMVIYGWYGLLYSVMMLVWYGPPEPRFLLPLLPLLLAGFGREAQEFLGLLGEAWRKASQPAATPRAARQAKENRIAAAVLAGVLVMLPIGMLQSARNAFALTGPAMLASERQQQGPLEKAYAWIRKHTPEQERFFTIDDPVFYLHTGRKALRSPELQKIFTAGPGGVLEPSAETLQVMRRFDLGCLFVSAKHFDRAPNSEPKLAFRTEGSELEERYRSATEVLACRPGRGLAEGTRGILDAAGQKKAAEELAGQFEARR